MGWRAMGGTCFHQVSEGWDWGCVWVWVWAGELVVRTVVVFSLILPGDFLVGRNLLPGKKVSLSEKRRIHAEYEECEAGVAQEFASS